MKGKTLYISDLDGTLLNRNAELSAYTSDALNLLSGKGVCISAATARTAATVSGIMKDTKLNYPVVLMNGVCTFDFNTKKYISVSYIDYETKKQAMNILGSYDLAGFWYAVEDNVLSTYYENTNSPGAVEFIEERSRKYGKVFTRVNAFTEDILDKNLLYFSLSDYENRLNPAAEKLRELDNLRMEYYRDIYKKDCFFLELCSGEASKHTAVDELRNSYGFEKIVGFGDNYNDIPLLEACDEFYAVENAVDALKEKATGIIGSNIDDGVAKWLLNNAE